MVTDGYPDARILIVDDEPANVRLLERILQREGYRRIESTHDPREFLALFDADRPDLVLLDLHMPALDGFSVLERLQDRIGPDDYVPILVLSADITPQARQRALAGGAKDFLTKPVDPTDVVLRIRNLLETRYYYGHLKNQNQTLEGVVHERTAALERAQIEILERLARAAEYRDDETGLHAQRVGHTAALIGRRLGLSDEEVVLLRRAAPLHDVGKIGIPDEILLKPGTLTAREFATMKEHTAIGAGILSGSGFAVLQMAEEIALYHHENWDGSGYMGLRGEEAPLAARIVHAADVFDALTHERPYKEAWPVEEAIGRIQSLAGEFFEADVVDALLAVHADGRMQVRGSPPPIGDLFRDGADPGSGDTVSLAARAAAAEVRAGTRAWTDGSLAPPPAS